MAELGAMAGRPSQGDQREGSGQLVPGVGLTDAVDEHGGLDLEGDSKALDCR